MKILKKNSKKTKSGKLIKKKNSKKTKPGNLIKKKNSKKTKPGKLIKKKNSKKTKSGNLIKKKNKIPYFAHGGSNSSEEDEIEEEVSSESDSESYSESDAEEVSYEAIDEDDSESDSEIKEKIIYPDIQAKVSKLKEIVKKRRKEEKLAHRQRTRPRSAPIYKRKKIKFKRRLSNICDDDIITLAGNYSVFKTAQIIHSDFTTHKLNRHCLELYNHIPSVETLLEKMVAAFNNFYRERDKGNRGTEKHSQYWEWWNSDPTRPDGEELIFNPEHSPI